MEKRRRRKWPGTGDGGEIKAIRFEADQSCRMSQLAHAILNLEECVDGRATQNPEISLAFYVHSHKPTGVPVEDARKQPPDQAAFFDSAINPDDDIRAIPTALDHFRHLVERIIFGHNDARVISDG